MRYARPLLRRAGAPVIKPEDVDLEAFVDASQRAQAIGLQVAIEHLRRKKYACSGSVVWQLNEPWPAISWSLVDYLWHPKPAYQAVRRAYDPLKPFDLGPAARQAFRALDEHVVFFGLAAEFASVCLVSDAHFHVGAAGANLTAAFEEVQRLSELLVGPEADVVRERIDAQLRYLFSFRAECSPRASQHGCRRTSGNRK